MTTDQRSLVAGAVGPGSTLRSDVTLLGPAALLFLVVLIVPVAVMLLTSLNPSERGAVALEPVVTLENYARLVGTELYPAAAWRSVLFGLLTAGITIVLGFPVAFVMAFTRDLRILTLMTILLLMPFQLDVVVRVLGLVVLLGNEGLVNQTLSSVGLIDDPLPLMYNDLGVLIGTSTFMLPFVVFTLVGSIRLVDPELMLAGRSLGFGYWASFRRIFLPLSLPGIAAAALVAFTLTISNFIVPVLMSAYRSQVLPALMHEQVTVVANFRFAAAMGVALLLVSLVTLMIGYRLLRRITVLA